MEAINNRLKSRALELLGLARRAGVLEKGIWPTQSANIGIISIGGPRNTGRIHSQRKNKTAIKPTHPISIQTVRRALWALRSSLYQGIFK